MPNPIGWFEIPVNDMDRAKKFYSQVFQVEFQMMDLGGTQMALFPMDPEGKGTSGSLIHNEEFYTPSDEGPLLYFSAYSGDVQIELERAVEAGGEVIVPKTQISEEHGHMAVFRDTEGNRIALHTSS